MSEVCISIVSHAQSFLANQLLDDLGRNCPDVDLIFTSNIDEPSPLDFRLWPRVTHLINSSPKGFGSNHNAAFRHCTATYFCVVNPDIRITSNPFPEMLAVMDDTKIGVVAPKVLSPSGGIEDNARFFPTPFGLLQKALGIEDGCFPVAGTQPMSVDWVAGMFLLFRADAFASIGGFDEKFFLYYEDVDICARLWRTGKKVVVIPNVSVVHDAQRMSRKNLRYMTWHLGSMVRYFSKHLWRLPR